MLIRSPSIVSRAAVRLNRCRHGGGVSLFQRVWDDEGWEEDDEHGRDRQDQRQLRHAHELVLEENPAQDCGPERIDRNQQQRLGGGCVHERHGEGDLNDHLQYDDHREVHGRSAHPGYDGTATARILPEHECKCKDGCEQRLEEEDEAGCATSGLCIPHEHGIGRHGDDAERGQRGPKYGSVGSFRLPAHLRRRHSQRLRLSPVFVRCFHAICKGHRLMVDERQQAKDHLWGTARATQSHST